MQGKQQQPYTKAADRDALSYSTVQSAESESAAAPGGGKKKGGRGCCFPSCPRPNPRTRWCPSIMNWFVSSAAKVCGKRGRKTNENDDDLCKDMCIQSQQTSKQTNQKRERERGNSITSWSIHSAKSRLPRKSLPQRIIRSRWVGWQRRWVTHTHALFL